MGGAVTHSHGALTLLIALSLSCTSCPQGLAGRDLPSSRALTRPRQNFRNFSARFRKREEDNERDDISTDSGREASQLQGDSSNTTDKPLSSFGRVLEIEDNIGEIDHFDQFLMIEADTSGWSPYGERRQKRGFLYSPLESHRPIYRTQFDFQDWVDHRSITRFLANILNVPFSGLTKALLLPTLIVAAWTATVVHFGLPPVSMLPFNATAFVLALLLGFRTNIAYSRWNQACQLWEQVSATCRTAARLCVIHTRAAGLAARACRWIKAYALVHLYRMRGDPDINDALAGFLPRAQATAVANARDPPLHCLQELSFMVGTTMSEKSFNVLESTLGQMETAMAQCDAIIRSPIPLFFSQHVSRFMTVWLLLLPLAIAPHMGWYAVPAMALIAFAVVGVDEITHQIEEPFGILPLETITYSLNQSIDTLVRARCARHPEHIRHSERRHTRRQRR